jgi:hypothetical protein
MGEGKLKINKLQNTLKVVGAKLSFTIPLIWRVKDLCLSDINKSLLFGLFLFVLVLFSC